jgi:hypothetical protein
MALVAVRRDEDGALSASAKPVSMEGNVKVFISWSGDNSKKIASLLHGWIPTVLQNVKPYMSAESIEKGQRWSIDIADQLQETNYGIICVTPDNINAPWVLFESGALSKSVVNSRVTPIIFGLNPSDLSNSPLLQFQLSQFNKSEINKVLESINESAADPEKITRDLLVRTFERAWPEIESDVSKIDLSNLKEQGGHAALKSGELNQKIEAAIEEILSNTRSQIKILNSPTDILPPRYFSQIIKDNYGNEICGPSANHPIWREIHRSLAYLSEAAAYVDMISNNPADAPSGIEGASRRLANAHQQLEGAFNYLMEEISGRRLRFPPKNPRSKSDTDGEE